MEAVPQPIRIEFLKNKEIVATADESALLDRLRFQSEDFRLADTIEDETGKKQSIEMETNGFDHVMKFAEKEIPDWYSSYLERISR